MSAYRFQRDGAEWSRDEWRALDRAMHRWVRVHGGSERLAATAAWASLADGDGDAALPLTGGDRYAMLPLAQADIAALRAEALVASDPATQMRPFVLDAANRFYLWRNYQQEREAAALIRTRRAGAIPASVDAEQIEADLDVLFAGDRRAELDAQRQAVRRVAGRRLFVLTGGPGTGKTTTVLRMLLMLQRRATAPLAIRIAAPTGKAAQRLVQALRQGKLGLRDRASAPLPAAWLPLLDAIPDADALTVHRLLDYEPWRNAFRRGAHDPVAADVVVIDEASMIDLAMLRALLGAVKADATLILVGDADQLTSVATGSVLMDIVAALESDGGGDLVRLHHSFRAQRHLVALNEAVRAGDAAAVADALAAAPEAIDLREVESPAQLAERLARWSRDLTAAGDLRPTLPAADRQSGASTLPSTADTRVQHVRDALAALARQQLLCALREGPFGAVTANSVIERALRKAWRIGANAEWYAGRAVIVTRNDYAARLFNGDVGICLADSDGRLRVWFEAPGSHGAVRAFAPNTLPLHESAFAITIHKSQGSEYDRAAVLLPPDSENRILSRQLLYTAVSRARHGVELWAAPAALETALRRPIARQGGLRDRLLAQ
jgi:exodeoxyribonuclease V alpha subunit